MQKKNMIALTIMALLLLALTSLAIISNPAAARLRHREGRVEPLPSALQGSVRVSYHYYGWPDGLSVLVIDHVNGKQLKPGEHSNVWVVSGGSSVRGGGGTLWFRSRYAREVKRTITVSVQSSGDKRNIEMNLDHRFESYDAFFARILIGVPVKSYAVTSDTVFFIYHQLDGSKEVKQIDIDLSDLVGEAEDGALQMRGVPTGEEIEAYLVNKPAILELLLPEKREQK